MRKTGYKSWTSRELKVLKKLFQAKQNDSHITISTIAGVLKRTISSIHFKIYELRLIDKYPRKTDIDYKLLKQVLGQGGVKNV